MLGSNGLPAECSALNSQTYYEEHAKEYAASTLNLDLSSLYKRFLPLIPGGGLILDAGSGSGRDTLAFLKSGYQVEAFDASQKLCEISSKLTGVQTLRLRFQDFNEANRYDGIWACASLLHVPKVDLCDTLVRLVVALRPAGTFYMSFKHGGAERIAGDGRFYNDVTEDELYTLLSKFSNICIEDLWLSEGESRLKGKGEWVNAVIRRTEKREET